MFWSWWLGGLVARWPIESHVVNRLLVIVFVVLISVPGLGLLVTRDVSTNSVSEMRALAPLPSLSPTWGSVTGFVPAFQQYFSDHFALRVPLIQARNAIVLHALRTAPSATVVRGVDGSVFYADDGALDDWIEEKPFTREELETWRQLLLARRAWLAARGIPYLFVIAPDRQMVYPELMPASLRRMRGDFQADQLIAYLRATSDFEVLDLRPVILAHKQDDEILYHRYDSHWTDRGGLLGYQEIVRRLQRWFPEMRPLARADFDAVPGVPSGDRVAILDLHDPVKDRTPGLVLRRGSAYRVVEPAEPDPFGEEGRLVTEHRDRTLPRAVIFRDSFAGRLIPYLSEHFSRATYLWQNNFDPDVILRERPDIVIQEMAGRHLCVWGAYIDAPVP